MFKIHADYMNFVDNAGGDQVKGQILGQQFARGLEILGYKSSSISLIREYAHLLGFYLNRPDTAVKILEKGLAFPALRIVETGELKTELADICVYSDDPWEATLIYSQVIDANRDNALGDEAKLKKARLGYYLGNFGWAKAQLDVLKASTSKLTANDAMELSLFITNNIEQDSLELPLQYFSRADLLFFRKKDEQALMVLDSIGVLFPYHSLADDVMFRRAKIEIRRNDYDAAVKLLEKIVKDYSSGLLADDALFLLGETFQYKLNDKVKASDAYKEILFSYPGSIFVSEARKLYRELTGEPSGADKNENSVKETPISDGKSSPR
jgi:tetratricopeptide (TPR) repeat protein